MKLFIYAHMVAYPISEWLELRLVMLVALEISNLFSFVADIMFTSKARQQALLVITEIQEAQIVKYSALPRVPTRL